MEYKIIDAHEDMARSMAMPEAAKSTRSKIEDKEQDVDMRHADN